MAFKYGERVQETSTSTGSGDLVLAGAPDTTYQAFSAVFSNGDTTDVAIFGVGGFESCRATYNSGANSITRGTRYASSNGGAAVNFGAGTKTIIVSAPGALLGPLEKGGMLGVPGGRPTLSTGVPVMSATVAPTGTLYYTPYHHNGIWLYNGSIWVYRSFAETSIALSAGTASKVHDVFGYDNAGTLALELLAWTNDTTRATALVRQDGVLCKTGDLTRRWLGSVYLDGSKQAQFKLGGIATGGAEGFIGLYSAYNRVPWTANPRDDTDSWGYTTNTWRAPNGYTTMRVTMLDGIGANVVDAVYCAGGYTSSAVGRVGVAIDATNTFHGMTGYNGAASASASIAVYRGVPGLGLHFAQATEWGAAGCTFFGDITAPTSNQTGLVVSGEY